jgi:isoleucyl-tRNA synthetase
VLDGEGRKMSKSLGNGIDPGDICKQNGADILRLWVASSDYHSDVRFSHDILKQLGDIYLKIRNTCRFLLGNLYDYDPARPGSVLTDLDKWALSRLEELRIKVMDAYESYEFHIVPHAVHNFCVLDMSNFYLDIVKDTLYCEKPDDPGRKAVQSVLFRILDTVTRLISPILAFTGEEIWEAAGMDGSPLYAGMPGPVIRSYLPGVVDVIFDDVRDAVNKALEDARNEKIIGKPLEAAVTLTVGGELYDKLEGHTGLLQKCFIVSALTLVKGDEMSVSISRAPGEKCERCWGFFTDLGTDSSHPALCARCAKAVTV